MEQRRRDLRAGEEHKSAFVQPGMGEGQGPGLKNQIVVKKEIEIEGAFGPALAPRATVLLLNRLQKLQQGQGGKDGGNRDDRIQVEPLSARSAAGQTFEEGRSRETVDPRRRAKTLPRPL